MYLKLFVMKTKSELKRMSVSALINLLPAQVTFGTTEFTQPEKRFIVCGYYNNDHVCTECNHNPAGGFSTDYYVLSDLVVFGATVKECLVDALIEIHKLLA